MKRNDITALHQQSVADLSKKLGELVTEVSKARIEKKAGKLAKPSLISRLQDDIARVKTILREKEVVTKESQTVTA